VFESVLAAASNSDLTTELQTLGAAMIFTAAGVLGWFVYRKKSPDDREAVRNTLIHSRAVIALFFGPAVVVIMVAVLIARLF
jgi:hypothetical protein